MPTKPCDSQAIYLTPLRQRSRSPKRYMQERIAGSGSRFRKPSKANPYVNFGTGGHYQRQARRQQTYRTGKRDRKHQDVAVKKVHSKPRRKPRAHRASRKSNRRARFADESVGKGKRNFVGGAGLYGKPGGGGRKRAKRKQRSIADLDRALDAYFGGGKAMDSDTYNTKVKVLDEKLHKYMTWATPSYKTCEIEGKGSPSAGILKASNADPMATTDVDMASLDASA